MPPERSTKHISSAQADTSLELLEADNTMNLSGLNPNYNTLAAHTPGGKLHLFHRRTQGRTGPAARTLK